MEKHYDVVIVGGAIMGSSLAYHLAVDKTFSGSVLVLEKDFSYQRCSTTLSAGSIRQQFSTAGNICMSQYGVEFLHHAEDWLEVDGIRPQISFIERGYLLLASASGEEILKHNHDQQCLRHAPVSLYTPNQIQQRFPWLNIEGIALAALGEEGEGWFSPDGLLGGLKRKARAGGVTYSRARVVGIDLQQHTVSAVTLDDGSKIGCGTLVNAAGCNAHQVAAMAGLDLPVESRKRFVFVFDCRESLGPCPLVVDPSGLYFRPEGQYYICGMSPKAEVDPECYDFDIDYSLFEEEIWPLLAHRVPAFEAIKLINAWAGHYAYNTLDQNAVLGPHPDMDNFLFMNGFSGHGIQQAPAVGRGVAELITYGDYRTLDLHCFDYQRITNKQPLRELNVI